MLANSKQYVGRRAMLQRLAIRAGIAILGVVVTLTWWTLTDKNRKQNGTSSSSKMPAKILGGGGQKVIIGEQLQQLRTWIIAQQHPLGGIVHKRRLHRNHRIAQNDEIGPAAY